MLVLSRSELEALTDPVATLSALRDALTRQGRTALTVAPNPLRSSVDDTGFVPLLGADLETGLVTSKTLVDSPANVGRGLPSQRSAITVIDSATGAVRALLHGAVPTRVRTAAVSALAAETLAREQASTLGLIGAGALALEHARAIHRVRGLESITVWSRTEDSRRRFRAELERIWDDGDMPRLHEAQSPEDVMAAEIVCTLTPSVDPVVSGAWLRPGQHLNVVGARPRPTDREVDAEAFRRSRVFVDDRATAAHESGDYLLARDGAGGLPPIAAELSEVLRGEAEGRRGDEEITLYNSVGTGLQDTAVAGVVLAAAAEAGAGTVIDIDA